MMYVFKGSSVISLFTCNDRQIRLTYYLKVLAKLKTGPREINRKTFNSNLTSHFIDKPQAESNLPSQKIRKVYLP